jgi:hypothetical protein
MMRGWPLPVLIANINITVNVSWYLQFEEHKL